MTTIAYKDGIIAYDSRVTSGSTILYDDSEKLVESRGVKFILSGSTSDIDAFIAAYFGEAPAGKIDTVALVVDGGKLWCASCDDEHGLWKCRVEPDKPYAIGSGTDHALTAMDMGASAVEAVEMAMKRDTCTGGRVRTLKVSEQIAADSALEDE